MSETRAEYIQRTYGCNENSIDHWDRQDAAHNGHIPGTATELKDIQKIVPYETIPETIVKPIVKKGRPKKEDK